MAGSPLHGWRGRLCPGWLGPSAPGGGVPSAPDARISSSPDGRISSAPGGQVPSSPGSGVASSPGGGVPSSLGGVLLCPGGRAPLHGWWGSLCPTWPGPLCPGWQGVLCPKGKVCPEPTAVRVAAAAPHRLTLVCFCDSSAFPAAGPFHRQREGLWRRDGVSMDCPSDDKPAPPAWKPSSPSVKRLQRRQPLWCRETRKPGFPGRGEREGAAPRASGSP